MTYWGDIRVFLLTLQFLSLWFVCLLNETCQKDPFQTGPVGRGVWIAAVYPHAQAHSRTLTCEIEPRKPALWHPVLPGVLPSPESSQEGAGAPS